MKKLLMCVGGIIGIMLGAFLGFGRLDFWRMEIVAAEEYGEMGSEILGESAGSGDSGGEVGTPDDGVLDGDADLSLYIKAINPGYTVDGKNNVGEMIEIGRSGGSDKMVSLAGITVRYTNSSGNESVLMEFPENSFMVGEVILLKLASSPGSELANVTYTKTLAFEGGVKLTRGDTVLDTVCWTGKEGCFPKFKSAAPTVLVRESAAEDFRSVAEYEPVFVAENYVLVAGEGKGSVGADDGDEDGGGDVEKSEKAPQCRGLVFSEILSFYEETQAEQFIEVYNAGAEQILMDGCVLRYKNKTYPLVGIVRPEEYRVRYLTDFAITKNPTNSGVVEIVDVDGAVVDKMEYPNGQRKGTSYAFIGYDSTGEEIWRTTYAVTPGEANVYQEYRSCEEGKVINEATGNCVKVTEVTEKTCEPGQYLNPETGRCKKIEEEKETECTEGYEINPETGRCRKIKENTGADYEIATEKFEEKSSFVALYAVIGVVAVGLLFVVFEFRKEITRLLRKLFRKVSR